MKQYPKWIYKGLEAIGVCGHKYGACTCDCFEYDPIATREAANDREDGYQEYLEQKGDEMRGK
jgi:hypothetical protein